MATIPDHIQIKLREADETPPKILELCCQHLVNPNDELLTEISVRLGTMSVGLRSALNNMMWDFAERVLQSLLPPDEYAKIQWSHDYPIEKDISGFESSKSRILIHVRKYFPEIYDFLEGSQPYNEDLSMLWTIKLLSNDSTHTIPVEIYQPNISIVVFDHGGRPKILGDTVIVPFDKNNPVVLKTPCFIEALDMFAAKDGRWIIYMIGIDQNPKYSVTGFIGGAYPLAKRIIINFYRLMETEL